MAHLAMKKSLCWVTPVQRWVWYMNNEKRMDTPLYVYKTHTPLQPYFAYRFHFCPLQFQVVIQVGRLDKFELHDEHRCDYEFLLPRFSSILNILPSLLNYPAAILTVHAQEIPKSEGYSEKLHKIANILGKYI